MLNRTTFTTGIVAAAIAGAAQALEDNDDDAIRDILRRRIEVEKRSVGMAVCVVTPNRQRIVTWGRERLSDDRPVTSDTIFEIGSVTKVFTALLLAETSRAGVKWGWAILSLAICRSTSSWPLRDGHEITRPQPLDAEQSIDEPGLQKHARLAGDAEHRSSSRAAQILHQSPEPHRIRVGGGLEYDASGQSDRDRGSRADSVHQGGGRYFRDLAAFRPGTGSRLALSPQRQSRRWQIIRAAKLTHRLAALFEQRQPLRALGWGPVNPRSWLRRRRRGQAHRCIRHQTGPSR
jgi:hypothetical protein